jgi:hypothetical protein
VASPTAPARRRHRAHIDGPSWLATVQAIAEAQPFHLVDLWRARMLERGLTGAAEFPGGADAPLPHLIEQDSASVSRVDRRAQHARGASPLVLGGR